MFISFISIHTIGFHDERSELHKSIVLPGRAIFKRLRMRTSRACMTIQRFCIRP